MSEYNILAHTTTNTFPCDEYISREEGIPPGGVCISKPSVEKMSKLLDKYSKQDRSKPIPVRDYDLMPFDGSEQSRIIRELASVYECDSELCVLFNKDVVKLLGKKQWENEVSRFKTIGPRYSMSGTCGHHQDDILTRWSRLFPGFHPLPCAYYIKTYEKNLLDEVSILDLLKSNPNIKTIGIPITIATYLSPEGQESGFHSVCIFIDFRNSSKFTIEYFDSGSMPMKNDILKWVERERSSLMNEYKDTKIETISISNKMVHQTETTSCGMFVLIFIRKRLEGIPPEMFSEYKIPDAFAINFRRHVYSM